MNFAPKQLGQSIDAIARDMLGPEWGAYAVLQQNWEQIVGADLCQQAKLARISVQPQGEHLAGTVTIQVPRGLAMEMQYRLHLMQRRMNNFFGYDAISRIIIEHSIN